MSRFVKESLVQNQLQKLRDRYNALDDADKARVKTRGIIGGVLGLVVVVLAVIFVSKAAGLFLGLVALVVVGLAVADVFISDVEEDDPVANAPGYYYFKPDGTPATDAEVTAHHADPTANPLTVRKVNPGDKLPAELASSTLQDYRPGQLFERVKDVILLACGMVILAAVLYRGGNVPPTPFQEWVDGFVGYVQEKKVAVDTTVKPAQPVAPIETTPEITADMKAKITRVSDTEASVPKAGKLRWVLIHEGKARYIEPGRAGVLERGDTLVFSASTSLNGGRVYVANAAGQTSETIPLPNVK